MPPKNKSPAPNRSQQTRAKSTEEVHEEMLEKLTFLTSKILDMEEAMKNITKENSNLKNTIRNQEDVIASLKDELNSREQYARSWSVRILNIQLEQGKETDTRYVMETVYKKLLLPILEGARASGEFTNIPTCDSLLETAHILPGKGSTKPIIARFYSRYWRGVIFRYRREHCPKTTTTTSGASNTRSGASSGATGANGSRTRPAYSIFEDLTGITFRQLKEFKKSENVQSAWTVNGTIKFKLINSDTIHKVSSIHETIDDFLS
jgi:hypothetical protein